MWPAGFALDLSNRERGGETAVVASDGSAYEHKNSRVDGSFGQWLLTTLKAVLPLSSEMWQRRIARPSNEISTKEYGQPGPAVYFRPVRMRKEVPFEAPDSRARQGRRSSFGEPRRYAGSTLLGLRSAHLGALPASQPPRTA
jgi:hypothetical protein